MTENSTETTETEFKTRRQAGNCDDCAMIHIIELHYETPMDEIPPEAEWESFGNCFVCGGDVGWVEYDSETSWEQTR